MLNITVNHYKVLFNTQYPLLFMPAVKPATFLLSSALNFSSSLQCSTNNGLFKLLILVLTNKHRCIYSYIRTGIYVLLWTFNVLLKIICCVLFVFFLSNLKLYVVWRLQIIICNNDDEIYPKQKSFFFKTNEGTFQEKV